MATMVIGQKEHSINFVGLKEIDMRRLARDLAMGLVDPALILECHGIDENRWVELCRNKRFLELLQDETQTWYAAKNISLDLCKDKPQLGSPPRTPANASSLRR